MIIFVMSSEEKGLFRINRIGLFRRRDFVGNGFVVTHAGGSDLFTAGHVAFDGVKPRKLEAISVDGATKLTSLTFRRQEGQDIATCSLPTPIDGFNVGNEILPGDYPELRLVYTHLDARKRVVPVSAICVDGINIMGERKQINPHTDNTIVYLSDNNSDSSKPGTSGAPILNRLGEVVAVHVGGACAKTATYGLSEKINRFFRR